MIGSAVDVSHDQSDCAFDAACRGGQGIVAGFWVVDNALEAEDSKVSPASWEVGVGDLVYGSEGHLFLIIRFGAHGDWIRMGVFAMQVRSGPSGMWEQIQSYGAEGSRKCTEPEA